MTGMRSKRTFSIIGVILSTVLVTAGLLASIGGFTNVDKESGYQSAQGTIVGVDNKKNNTPKNRTQHRCAPIVDFQVNGQTYKTISDEYSTYGKGSECKYSLGDEITVRYDPADPSNSTISDSTFEWMLGFIGAAVAITFGLVIPVRIIRRSRAEARNSLLN